jgi:dolichol kinase
MLSRVEIQRKIVHLLGLAIPIGYGLTSEETALEVILLLFLGFLFVDLLRQFHGGTASLFKKYIYGKVLREEEKSRLMGSTYYLFSALLTILLFPKPIALVSLLILILSDTCAALVGKGIGKIPIFRKTLEGTLAFFFSSLAIVLIFSPTDPLSEILGALGATLIELLPIPLDDNITIPFVAGAIMFFCKG